MFFYDDHVHFLWYGLTLIRPNLSVAKSKEDVGEIIKKSIENPLPFMWAEGWDESLWENKEIPTKDFLDKYVKNTPYIIRRVCGHKGVANSAAIEYLVENNLIEGLDIDTGIIEEGVILHLSDYIKPNKQEILLAIKSASDKFVSLNIKGFTDFSSVPYFESFIKNIPSSFPFKSFVFLIGEEGKKYLQYKKNNIKVMGLKYFVDGSIGAETAAISLPYKNTDNNGTLLMSFKDIANAINDAINNNYSLAFHAIGDRAIEEIIKGIKEIFPSPENLPFIRIEHFEISKKEHIQFAKDYNIHISVQPNFIVRWGMPNGMYEKKLPEKLYAIHNRFYLYKEYGLQFYFGSDCMPPGPKYAIENLTCKLDKETLYKHYVFDNRPYSY